MARRQSSDTLTQAFLNDIGRYPLLTPQQEVMLARKVQKMVPLQEKEQNGEALTSDEKRVLRLGKKAQDRLVSCNLRLVVMIAKKYTNRVTHLSLLDLVQEGSMGLIRGAQLYDPARGYKFSTYAYWWIRQGITRGLVQQEHTIRPPYTVGEKMSKVRAVINRLAHTNKEMPNVSQIAEELEWDRAEVELMLQRGQRVTSLDAPAGSSDEHSTMGELVADPSSVDKNEDYAIDDFLRMEGALLKLDPRELQVLKMRHGLDDCYPMSFMAIGKALDLSRERVRQLEVRALRKMRMYMLQINPLSKPKVGRHLTRHRHENLDLIWARSGS